MGIILYIYMYFIDDINITIKIIYIWEFNINKCVFYLLIESTVIITISE